MRAKKYMQKALVVTLTSVMLAGTVAPALPAEAATQKVVVSNERTVLVAGRNYYVQNENATNFKSSDASVASIDENGKITPLKTGYVTISATVDGETVKNKFMCVSKFGVTASQKKVDKMLEAENVKNISIVTAKDVDYQIAEGDYSKKVLTVKAPNADVDNHGTFKKIKIKDVADNTFRNYKPNKFKITDNNFRFAEKAKGSEIEVADGAKGKVIAQGKDTVIKSSGKVEVKPQGKNVSIAKVEVNGGQIELNLKKLAKAIKEVLIQKAADVKISGGQKADVKVTVGEDAKGTTINSDTTVDLVVKAEITINLTGNAGGSKIDIADGIEVVVKVDANVDGAVTVGDTEVKAGETATVDETGKVEVTETPTEGETDQKPEDDKKDDTTNVPSGGGGGYVPSNPTVVPNTNGNTTTYTFTNTNSFTAKIQKGAYAGEVNMTVEALKGLQAQVADNLKDVNATLENWKNLQKDAAYSYGGTEDIIVVSPTANKELKNVTIGSGENKYSMAVSLEATNNGIRAIVDEGTDKEMIVVMNDATGKTFNITRNDVDYTVTINNNQISISGREDIKDFLTFTNLK